MRKMKDSGVNWIGLIPVDWKIDNPKYHFTEERSCTTRNGTAYRLAKNMESLLSLNMWSEQVQISLQFKRILIF